MIANERVVRCECIVVSAEMDAVENVDIDASGKFKYILIKVTDKATRDSKFIVRGYERCGYHGTYIIADC